MSCLVRGGGDGGRAGSHSQAVPLRPSAADGITGRGSSEGKGPVCMTFPHIGHRPCSADGNFPLDLMVQGLGSSPNPRISSFWLSSPSRCLHLPLQPLRRPAGPPLPVPLHHRWPFPTLHGNRWNIKNRTGEGGFLCGGVGVGDCVKFSQLLPLGDPKPRSLLCSERPPGTSHGWTQPEARAAWAWR